MSKAGIAIDVLQIVAATGAVGCLGVMRHRLGGVRLVLAAGRVGRGCLPECEEEEEQQRQHQAQGARCPGPAIRHHDSTRASLPALASAPGVVRHVPH
ncbi:hypothetical protein [Aminobacter sp. MSH1]|uniref:hypothetical protein n=1 Tax=Aminobacter sp. MSH1 TaxID=374606 RepID=UPI00131F00AD|nr:hypothetical protein [Aminobacter sp. MSH1]